MKLRGLKDRPVGVTAVGKLTLVASVYGFVYSSVIGAIKLGTRTGSWFRWIDFVLFLLPLALSLLAVVLGNGILRGWKWVWYALIPYWSVTIIVSYCGIWLAGTALTETFFLNIFVLIPLMPLAFSLAFLLYFQTSRVKDFFDV